MSTIPLHEAEARLGELVHDAARGHDVVITAGDGASVRLVPIVAAEHPEPTPSSDPDDESWGSLSLASALRGLEDDSLDYSEDDLVETYA